jgi:RimJ/RimL family protein N-acetyltransferase
MQEIKFPPCDWQEIQPLVENYVKENNITVESYWETHVLESKHYKMTAGGKTCGFFAIHGGNTIWLFNVFAPYANLAQEIFHEIKKYEQVNSAMVPTGDEFLLSHCLDNYAKLEKQAYISIYTEKVIPPERVKPLALRSADVERDAKFLKKTEFFSKEELEKIQKGDDSLKVYIVELDGAEVGVGVMEYGRVIKDIASIGMYVKDEYRRQGIAANILQSLKLIAEEKGCRVFSGCWYYNHNSKKTMESAGAYSKSRLIKFYF